MAYRKKRNKSVVDDSMAHSGRFMSILRVRRINTNLAHKFFDHVFNKVTS